MEFGLTRQVICLYGTFQTYMEFWGEGAEMPRQAIKKTGRRGPRPRGPFADKRKTLTTRITNKTRENLDAAAKATDRSLSQEIEFRLERSFLQDDADNRVREAVLEGIWTSFGGIIIFRTMRLMASMIQAIEQTTGKTWLKDPKTRNLVNSVFLEAVDQFWPAISDEVLSVRESAERKAAARKFLDVWRSNLPGASKKKRRTKKG